MTTFGVFKASSRPLLGGSAEPRDKLVGWFQQEDFAIAFTAALHREQIEKIGTILDTYEIRPLTFEELRRYWKVGHK